VNPDWVHSPPVLFYLPDKMTLIHVDLIQWKHPVMSLKSISAYMEGKNVGDAILIFFLGS